MIKIEFYVGIEFKGNKEELSRVELGTALAEADKLLTFTFGGYTASEAVGRYKDFQPESTSVYTIFADNLLHEDLPADIAGELAEIFHQESVLWTVSHVNGGFASKRLTPAK